MGSPEALSYRYLLRFAEGSAVSPLLLQLVFDKLESSRIPVFVKPIARAISVRAK